MAGRRTASLIALLAAVGAGGLGASPASAHLGHVILGAERYLKLDVADRGARVVVSLTLGPDEGRRVLEAADSSGDGRVDEAERDAYLAQWAEGLGDEVPIFVDGERVRVAWGEGFLDPIGAVRRAPVTVELVARVSLAGGEQTVRFEDRMVRREVYDRTDVAFRTRDAAELLGSGVDEAPTEVVRDFAYDGDFRDGAPIPVVARVRTPPRAARPWWPAAAGGAVLAIAAGASLWLRRRRSA